MEKINNEELLSEVAYAIELIYINSNNEYLKKALEKNKIIQNLKEINPGVF